MELVLCLCVLLGTEFRAGVGAEPFIDEPPANIVAIQGDTILLTCGVDPRLTATLLWQDMDTDYFLTNGSRIDPKQNFPLSTRARLRIVGDRVNGEYHLQIRDVVGADGGRYACYYYDTTTLTHQYSNIATLSIMTPPTKGFPNCHMEPTFGLVGVGDNITLICKSEGGNPPASLTWIRERDILNVKNTPSNGKPINRVSIVLTEQDVDKKYVCLARNPATKQPLSCVVKPLRSSIELRVQPSSLIAYPETPAIFNCIGEVVPDLVYTWYVNEQLVDGTHGRYTTKRDGKRLNIYPVLLSDDYSSVKCVVKHARYKLSGSATALLWVEPVIDTILSTASPVVTTKPIGIHQGPNGGQGLVNRDVNAIDINQFVKTWNDPALYEPVIPERTSTLNPPAESTNDIIKTVTRSSKLTKIPPLANNQLCRGDTCVTTTTVSVSTETTTVSENLSNTEPSNEIPTPPLNKLSEAPLPPKQSSSNGLAIGLPLGLIFLALIVLIIIGILVWKKKRSN